MPKSLAAQLKRKTEPRKKKGRGLGAPRRGEEYEQFFANKPELVNTDDYIPPAGDWDEENVVWKFSDGWTINECLTRYDIQLVAYLTRTCVSRYNVRGPQFDEVTYLENAKSKELEYYIQQLQYSVYFSEAEKKKKVAARMKNYKPRQPSQRIFRLTDPEGRPRCMILCLVDGCTGVGYEAGGYSTSRDLGEQAPFEVSGMLLHLLEARMGTGAKVPDVAMPYLQEWYKATIQGEWDEEKFKKAIPRRWAAYNYTKAPDREEKDTVLPDEVYVETSLILMKEA